MITVKTYVPISMCENHALTPVEHVLALIARIMSFREKPLGIQIVAVGLHKMRARKKRGETCFVMLIIVDLCTLMSFRFT